MKYKVTIRPEAENDLEEAFLWYEDKRTGLGHNFLLHVDARIKLISRNPEVHPIEYNGTRKHLIKRFPYKIICFSKEDRTIILAVIHGMRSPDLTKAGIDGL